MMMITVGAAVKIIIVVLNRQYTRQTCPQEGGGEGLHCNALSNAPRIETGSVMVTAECANNNNSEKEQVRRSY